MVKKEDQKAKEFEKHKEGLLERKKFLSTAKENLKEFDKTIKETSEDLEKVSEVTDNEIIAIELIDCSKTQNLPEGLWVEYTKQREEDEKITETLGTMTSYLGSEADRVVSVASMISTATDITTSGTVATVLGGFPNQPERFYNVVQDLKKSDCTPSHIQLISDFLSKEFPDLLNSFHSFVGEWNLSQDDNSRIGCLIKLRTLIFEQIFGTLDIAQQKVQRTNWFRQGIRGRFAQSKLFILGQNDATTISSIDMTNVDKVSGALKTCFDNLAELGKAHASSISFETCYKRTLANLTSAIELRSRLYN